MRYSPGSDLTWFFLSRTFRRVRIDFSSSSKAAAARTELDMKVFGVNPIHCYFIKVTSLQHHNGHLQLPESDVADASSLILMLWTRSISSRSRIIYGIRDLASAQQHVVNFGSDIGLLVNQSAKGTF